MAKATEVTDIEEWETLTEEYKIVEDESITDQHRWQTYYTMVVQDPEGNYWRLNWSQGSTEYQDTGWEYEMHEKQQVQPKQVSKTIYV